MQGFLLDLSLPLAQDGNTPGELGSNALWSGSLFPFPKLS